MRKFITILLILIIIGLGAAPFFLTETINNSLTVGTAIVSALSSIVTLLIALLLYSKYGIEKSVINKQTEVVFNLLTELKKTRFLILWDKGNLLQLRLDTLRKDLFSDYKDKKLLFDRSYIEQANNIWEITEDVFLPIEIMNTIRPLLITILATETDKDKFMLVTVPGYSDKIKDNFFGKLNEKDMTLQEFINYWTLVIKTSKKWLKEHSNITVDLNFERN